MFRQLPIDRHQLGISLLAFGLQNASDIVHDLYYLVRLFY
jgi:hypothetical protein